MSAEPKQDRAVATRAKILVHAHNHLRTVGVRRFSTEAVAKRAGVSVGIIYRYWVNAEALIEELAPGACHPWLKPVALNNLPTALAMLGLTETKGVTRG